MIVVLIDKKEHWLEYIWEQFVKINLLQTPSIIKTYHEYMNSQEKGSSDVCIVEYGKKQLYRDSLFIPQKNDYSTDNYIWIDDRLPVFRDTVVEKEEYDILYNAFVHLSRLEERQVASADRLNAYSFNHPRKDFRIWKIPVVNLLFNELEKKVTARFPSVDFRKQEKPVVEYSHDVDYLEKTIQLRIKQTAFYFFNAGRSVLHGRFRESLQNSAHGMWFFVKNSEYWCFDSWTELEEKFNIKSIFYIYSASRGNRKYNLKRWLIDPSYDISMNKKLQDTCRELMLRGIKIGLHGSFYSGMDEALFRKEKETLENAINSGVTKSRIHWLNYYDNTTPIILENCGIHEDSSIAYNDISGFRAGVASQYNPYDHDNRRAYDFTEIPLVIMDSHIYDYSMHSPELLLDWFYDSLSAVKNFTVSIDWHQRVLHDDYCWDGAYRNIVERIKKSIV